MSSSLRKIAPRRTHKERAQPSSRAKFGLLEKHKDYVLRARNFHTKEKRILSLQAKARARNPDEFYHAMENAKTKGGVHIVERNEKFSEEFLKLLKTQDKAFVTSSRSVNAKKMDKLKESLHFLGASADKGDDEEEGAATMLPRGQHTVFVDTEADVAQFDASEHFDTPAEFMARKFNRPTRTMLETAAMPDVKSTLSATTIKAAERKRAATYAELASRMSRDEQLRSAELEMEIQKALMNKGRRRKVGEDARGLAIYKWKAERKK
ncbi:small-subunit processome [Blastocladiella britannica]|nr:small-subunit processome [Blastocladiella britannica]